MPTNGVAVPPHWGVNFAVHDADATVQHAAALGGAVLMGPMDTPGFRNALTRADRRPKRYAGIKPRHEPNRRTGATDGCATWQAGNRQLMPKRAVVLGATGQIGRAVVHALSSRGWEVRGLSRGQRERPVELDAEVATVDRDQDEALAAALPANTDALVDIVAYTPAHAAQLLKLQGRVESLVVISSASVYADDQGRTIDEAIDEASFPALPVPIPETQLTARPGDATYSTQKVAMEQTLLEQDAIPVTVLRPCAVHGPGAEGAREWWVVGRARDARRYLPLAYGGGTTFHPTSTANLAELACLAAEQPGTRVLNCGDPDPPDVRTLVRLAGAAVDYHPIEVLLPGAPEAAVGESPWTAPKPFILDMTAAQQALGYKPVTTYAAAVQETSRWLLDHTRARFWQEALPQLAPAADVIFPYEAEDMLLQRLTGVGPMI